MQSGLSSRADILPVSDVESVGTTGETQDILQVSTDNYNGVNDNANDNGDNNDDAMTAEITITNTSSFRSVPVVEERIQLKANQSVVLVCESKGIICLTDESRNYCEYVLFSTLGGFPAPSLTWWFNYQLRDNSYERSV